MSELSKRIKQRREELNLSQDELARKLGYKSRSSINKIESGDNDVPQSKIEAFAKALEMSPSELMGWSEERMQYLRENRNTVIIQRLLGFMGCKIEMKWSELEGNFIEPAGYTVEYNKASFDITTEEFTELINSIKSYISFKIHELSETKLSKQESDNLNNDKTNEEV
ncbi:helix-turn-helix transcriptional regulator [Sedimentibacter hydroxybenzoicus DSM 7310]|uniref:Helix-turn-helix transcriptional regulator n=1 Tax=Sedimentibacter hydroxybenzoicus DSM 7310 TaxID=1123245 RepID=A0A974BHS7_SEDHY|nr:helix-turn-helix transcriptional regulator [Sedimentibacter hydroxybenzoicus]NYB73413.1 helix-turn-helix transcriptional regulator [Sedimentibacter hydroxybenzoicus DSM 7310]